jgi:Acetyltransferase (GNAT) domain
MLGRGKSSSLANSATGTTTVAYSYRIFNSIEHVDLTEWQRVRSACDGSIATDPRFLAAVEISMKQVERFWYIILYDENGAPVACTSVSAMTVDLMDFADPALARIIRLTPLKFSRLQHSKLLIGGLPIGTGQHALALAQPSGSGQILPVLDKVICDLATEVQADAILYKEFAEGDLTWTEPLLDLGYHRLPTPPLYSFRLAFDDFAQYCAALRARYRLQIKNSRRKLTDAGLEITVLSDPEEILEAYTSEVHALYHQMADRAAIKVEVLPVELLHQLAMRLNGQIELLVIRKDARILAFASCLHAQSSYYTMYGGLDYRLNREFDLYFNLIYALLEHGLQKRVSTIVFGMGADGVKARIGCSAEQLYVFVKGRGPLMSFMVRAAGNFLIAQKPATARFNIFKNEALKISSDRRPTIA